MRNRVVARSSDEEWLRPIMKNEAAVLVNKKTRAAESYSGRKMLSKKSGVNTILDRETYIGNIVSWTTDLEQKIHFLNRQLHSI